MRAAVCVPLHADRTPRPPPIPPTPPPTPPRPPPRPPAPWPRAANTTNTTNTITYRGCYSLAGIGSSSSSSSSSSSVLAAPGANVSAVALLINVTSSGLNLTLQACASRAAAMSYSRFAVEGYSSTVGGAIRLTATCYGLRWPVPANASTTGNGTLGGSGLQLIELPASRCTAVPCATATAAAAATSGGQQQRPACGTGKPGGLVLYDVAAP